MMKLCSVLVLSLLWSPVLAEEPPRVHEHPAAGQPDPYAGLLSPEGWGCCGGKDCKPREVRYDGRLQAWIEEASAWVDVDLNRVIGPPPPGTPLGTIVVCWVSNAAIKQRCVLMGGVV